MFDVGFAEVMIIGVVALIVIGPERLPDVARKVGRWVAKIQRFIKGVRSDVSRELESGELKALIGDQKDQINELRGMVKDAQKDIEKSTSSVMKDAESSFSELENSVKGSSDTSTSTELLTDSSDVSSDATTKQSSN
ncbi:MAG: Sec-independent protein translocase protein TatB [Granulosicoccaceae bacterium]